jgi:penicillin-binding protein 2
VAIEPTTGGILAMVSVPNYDPNLFVDGIDTQSWRELNESLAEAYGQSCAQWRLSARLHVQALHGIGRTVELGKRRPEQAIADPGGLQFRRPLLPRRQEGRPRHGRHVQVDRASPATPTTMCWPTTWASTTSPHSWVSWASAAAPGSTSRANRKGVLPSQQWKKERFKKPEQQKWYAGETISIGIGQGYNAYTPIQLAQATATIANNGV